MVRSFLLLVVLAVFAPGTQAQEQMILHAFTEDAGGLPAGAILDLDSRYVETSGSSVTQWTDRSGSGNHATPPGTAPKFEAGVFGELPGVLFGPSDLVDNRLHTSQAPVLGNDPLHVFVVYQTHPNASYHGLPVVSMGESDDAGSGFLLVSRSLDQDPHGDPSLQSGGVDATYGWSSFGKGNPRVFNTPILADAYWDGSEAGVSYNGLSHATVSDRLQRLSDRPMKIGNRDTGNSLTVFRGHIARVIVYPRRLSDAERQRACAALMALYGITP